MAKPLNKDPAKKQKGKEYIANNRSKKTDKMKNSKGFFGYFEGLEKPPKISGPRPKELIELLEGIKKVKPFYRGKDPKMTPLTNYFYCRYMASWLKYTGIAGQSLDITSHIRMAKKGDALDRFVTYSNLIENVYGPDEDFLEKLFPFDRVATIGEKTGLLQKQYGMLRANERKAFRKLASEIKIPLTQVQDGKRWGHTVAYYLGEYLKSGVKLSSLDRDVPVIKNTQYEPVFLESGAYLVGTGSEIEYAEKTSKRGIANWYFQIDLTDEESVLPNENSDEYDTFGSTEFTLRYLPSSNEAGNGYSHYLLEPDEKEPHSIYLEDKKVFLKRVKKKKGKGKEWVGDADIRLVSPGDSFLPPNPKEFKSFEALGNVVEAQMAHFATVATEQENKEPGNAFEEIHFGLLGTKNNPGIAVYHANIFYHNLLAQARDPIANFQGVDQNLLVGGRLISIEAYLKSPMKVMAYWMMSFRNYVEFQGIDPIKDKPRIVSPKRISVSEGIVDEAAKAEMTNSLSKLILAYYRCMYSMLKNKPFSYPRTMSKAKKDSDSAPREAKDEAIEDEFAEFLDLKELWDDLLKDVNLASIKPSIISSIITYVYFDGQGVINYPASMNPDALGSQSDWGKDSVSKWLKFSYSTNPTNIDAFTECASIVYAAIEMTAYDNASGHVEGIQRFLASVDNQGGYAYLLAILSLNESNAITDERASTFKPKGYESFMPPDTRKNPSKLKKKAEPDQEYMVNIELELPVKIELENLDIHEHLEGSHVDEATKLFDRINEGLEEAGIDEPAHIGTNGTILDIGWYVSGLDGAIDLLAHVTELYSDLGIAGRGWLEWGQEEMRKNYTVDGYSLDDI